MKRTLMIFAIVLLLAAGFQSWARADESNEGVIAREGPSAEAVEVETILLEDGTEEVQKTRSVSPTYAQLPRDERIAAIETEARARIKALMEEIRGLADRSGEGEIQRRIERIKMDAEIERLTLLKEDAEKQGDEEKAYELANELDHLGSIDEPVIGEPEQRPPQ